MTSHVVEPFAVIFHTLHMLFASIPRKHWRAPSWLSPIAAPTAPNSTQGRASRIEVPDGTPVTFCFPVTPLVPRDKVHAATAMLCIYQTPRNEVQLPDMPFYIIDWIVSEGLAVWHKDQLSFIPTKRGVRWVRSMLEAPLP